MCHTCSMSVANQAILEAWADNGCPYTKLRVLRRPSAVTSPNTFVMFFEGAVTIGGASKTVKVDVHYEGAMIEPGRDLVALGGLWISGVNGDMKPQQHGGVLKSALNNYCPGKAPAIDDGVYGAP